MAKKRLTLNSLASFFLTLVLAGSSFYSLSWIEGLERVTYEEASRLAASERQADPRIVLVDIDEKSIEKLGSWPWPRSRVAEMIDILREKGVKVIGMELPFLDREDNPGLSEVKSFWEKFQTYAFSKKDSSGIGWVQENLAEVEKRLDWDKLLITKVQEAGNVVFAAFTTVPPEQKDVPASDESLVETNALAEKDLPSSLVKELEVNNLYLPFPELAQAALGFGHGVDSLYDSLSGIAHAPMVSYRGSLIPSFPLRIAAAYYGLPPGRILAAKNRMRMKDEEIPLWKEHMLVKFYKSGEPFPRYAFADLLERKLSPLLQGKIVLIGLHFKGGPTVETPILGPLSEAEFHAWVLDGILNRAFISRPSYLVYMETLAILFFGALASIFFPSVGVWKRLAITAGFVTLVMGTEALILMRYGVWTRCTSVAVTVIALCALTSIWRRVGSLRFVNDSLETNRLLAVSFQNQGLLDLAFEKLRRLPLDEETKALTYNLGMEYEQRNLFSKAAAAYEHVLKGGPFRDLDTRIVKLQESDKSSTLGSHVKPASAGILNATPLDQIKRIGRYDILEIIGKGSMGLVYKALDPKINRLLAIKTIRFSDEFDDDVIQEIKERFFREAEIAGQLSHPSIVTIHDLGEDRDLTYMAMEYLEGEDLEKFISKKNLLPLRKVLHVVASVAEALDFAHHADVIHRDIKPANIRLLKTGGVKVTDFGIARAISSSRTRTGVILGTPNYMSPEQIMGQKVDPRSDIFSLGVLLYQLLTGELPFAGDNLSSLLYQITQVKQSALRNFNPKIPPACEQIVNKALAKNPKDRFRTASQMAKILRLLVLKIEQKQRKQLVEKEPAPRT
jgi:CHASE2 domain-containing sensor protein/tRNA A-37 threonylcarbamoyl transferase component Bud32